MFTMEILSFLKEQKVKIKITHFKVFAFIWFI